jgi:hypothetical protein
MPFRVQRKRTSSEAAKEKALVSLGPSDYSALLETAGSLKTHEVYAPLMGAQTVGVCAYLKLLIRLFLWCSAACQWENSFKSPCQRAIKTKSSGPFLYLFSHISTLNADPDGLQDFRAVVRTQVQSDCITLVGLDSAWNQMAGVTYSVIDIRVFNG